MLSATNESNKVTCEVRMDDGHSRVHFVGSNDVLVVKTQALGALTVSPQPHRVEHALAGPTAVPRHPKSLAATQN